MDRSSILRASTTRNHALVRTRGRARLHLSFSGLTALRLWQGLSRFSYIRYTWPTSGE